MSGLKAIPLSKAKTAYGLLRDVQRVILAEPTRVNMGVFTAPADDVARINRRPACNTVGCFAGWVNVLSVGRLAAMNADDFQAENLLGHDLNYRLPTGLQHYVFNGGGGDACGTTDPGTPAHARAVVRRIDGFIKRNLKALKARKLVAAADGTLSPAPGQD